MLAGLVVASTYSATLLFRTFAPLLLVTLTVVAAGCVDRQPESAAQLPAVRQLPPSATPVPVAGLGADDPRLGMDIVAGKPLPVVLLNNVLTTVMTRWVKNAAVTPLWSGPDAQASAAFVGLAHR